MSNRAEDNVGRVSRRAGILIALLSVAWWQWFIALSAVSAGALLATQKVESGTAHREVFWNISGGWAVYLMLSALIGALLYGPYRRFQYWALGQTSPITRDLRQSLRHRLRNGIALGLGTRRLPRYSYGGIMHFCIFTSFVALTIITTILALDDDTPLDFLHGDFYLVYSAAGDFFGLVGLLGVAMALLARRTDLAAGRRVRWEQRRQDFIITGGYGVLLISGLLAESMRIGATELHQHTDWARWSFLGWAIAGPLDAAGMSRDGFEAVHKGLWWFHIPAAFTWLAYIGYSKLGHIIFGPTNAFLKTTAPYGKLLAIENFETREVFGVGKIQDFTWKQLFELDVCVRCGRCTDNCPANIAGQPLSPMHIIQDLKAHLDTVGPSLIAEAATNGNGAHKHEFEPMVGGAIKDESLWACRTCGACVQECPVFIEHVPTIVDMRRWLVMDEARMPETVQGVLTNIEQRGHPWRGTALTRTSWIETLGQDAPIFTGEQEYLYWVGCSGALVERNVPITQATIRLLIEAKVDFGILGQEETCSGDPARRLGHEYLYQMLAQQNIEQLNAKGVKKVITQCPHCFNTMMNEYPDFGGQYEVIHHAQFLKQLLDEGKLRPKQGTGEKITYHDSCYLGRHNGVYDAPRDVLKAIPGIDLVEMPRNRSKGLCCGAGGGNMWMDESVGRRVNHVRTEEAVGTGAGIVATACPFCIQMFEDGIPSIQSEDDPNRMRALDIAELLEVAAVGRPAAAGAGAPNAGEPSAVVASDGDEKGD